MSSPPWRVLLVEDDEDDYILVRDLLSEVAISSYALEWKSSYDAAWEAMEGYPFDVCLLDYRLGERTGLELLRELTKKGCPTPIIFLTGQGDYHVDVEAMKAGAADYLVKDQITAPVLERSIRYAIEHKRAEKERKLLVTAVEQAAEGVMVVDRRFVVLYVNPAVLEMTGYDWEDIVGQDVKMVRSDQREEAFYQSVRKTVAAGNVWTDLYPMRRKDGTAALLKTSIAPVKDESAAITHYVVHCHDITEQRRLEEHLRHAQKMEAIGTLAGGIAHDFNNILAAILNSTELAVTDVFEESDARKNLDQIMKAVLRGRDLVRQILAFSRKTEKERKPFSLSPLLKETFKLLRASLPTTIDMRLYLETESDSICGDPSQVQQVIMNLCTNAADAIGEKGGKLEIALQDLTLRPGDPLPEADMSPGEFVVLSVKDAGPGIDQAVKERMFEPFFTTKPPGRGTGLGLSVVYGIVKSHQGAITASNEPGQGAVFKVFFPKTAPVVPVRKESPKPIPGGSERILFVDDEEIIVETARSLLLRLGYSATCMTDSSEALKCFSENPSGFDLVITDQTMPTMTGEHLAEEMIRLKPDIPIILCTGHSDVISPEKAKAMGIRGFIIKPVTIREMAEAIRSVLPRKDLS